MTLGATAGLIARRKSLCQRGLVRTRSQPNAVIAEFCGGVGPLTMDFGV